MSETRFYQDIILRSTTCFCLLAGAVAVEVHQPVKAQSSQGVSLNLGVLDGIAPMATVPRLLMPSTRTTTGRIVLKPPPGVNAITLQRARVVLRPPPGTPARVTLAPTITVPQPAAAATAPPTSVTTTPTRAPAPPAPIPAPVVAVAEPPVEAPASEVEIVADTMPMPAPAVAETSTATPAADADKDMPEQTASLPPSNEPGPITIQFGMEETDLPASASSPLNELATLLKVDGTLRVQLMAYASSVDGSPSSVRRKSLSRALSVREFLMDQGVQSTRIEVRALGDQNEGGAPDRVDAVVEKR